MYEVSCNIKMFLFVVMSISCVWGENGFTPTQQCTGESVKNLQERIQIEPCGKKKCELLRGSNTTVTIRFKPEEKVETLVNEVYADILGIRLPFVGVSGTNACKNVSRVDTGDMVSCPLSANEEYIYSIVFPVEQFYPPISTRVLWSLNSGNKKLICFVLPVVIK